MDDKKIILAPVITEKSLINATANKYTFYIAKRSTKREVAEAVSKKFKVDVLDVKIINIRGKQVRFGKKQIRGQRKDRRKAVVIVKPGQKIEIFDLDIEGKK